MTGPLLLGVGPGVLLCMELGGLFMMMDCMKMVSVSYVSMMGSLFVVAVLVMLGCFLVMLGCLLKMFRRLGVVFYSFRHDMPPLDQVYSQYILAASDYTINRYPRAAT